MAETFEVESRAGDEGAASRRVARVYAEALLSAADERNEADAVGAELAELVTVVLRNDPEIEKALSSPVARRDDKSVVIAKAFKDRVHPLLYNTLEVLNSKDRLGILSQLAAAYRDLLDVKSKRIRVSVRAVTTPTDAQIDELRKAIGAAYGQEPVIKVQIDEQLLGGMIVQVGDHVFDGSVRTRIENIRNQLLARSSYEIQVGRDRFSTAG